ncbi:MAG: hypothetical protein F4W95_06670 [Chloroflexi bacterium]|nr:hypothetical protein [Chloroflexota bacterium]MYD48153.1 hypothetical protein [Chloroflexota bacterium]
MQPLDRKGYGEHQGRRQAEASNDAGRRGRRWPENCDVCGQQLPSHIARVGATLHPACRRAASRPGVLSIFAG